jgi:hypothetical protein
MKITKEQLRQIIREEVSRSRLSRSIRLIESADAFVKPFETADWDNDAAYMEPSGQSGWTVRIDFDRLSRHERDVVDLAAENLGLEMVSDDPGYSETDPKDVNGMVAFVFGVAFDAEAFVDEVASRIPQKSHAIEGFKPYANSRPRPVG